MPLEPVEPEKFFQRQRLGRPLLHGISRFLRKPRGVAGFLLGASTAKPDEKSGKVMSELIYFHHKKQEILRDALIEAEASVEHHHARIDWLKRTGASLAELVKASLVVERAIHDYRKCEAELNRLSGHCASSNP